ncbi:hypothetical protein [Celeribacter litoreus]|uniref:hypothetical protein n=1 Tax=Celeribacter litoreus TaxID=2876714 RepID=UPI001CD02014|nr:hypothetical protein [Celeribacter litoreus]MCA0044158.1 hypothetical protein [Celeribacter litoreus]
MTRHITDKPHSSSGNGRLTHYTEVEKSQKRSATWDKVERAPKEHDDTSRVKQFLRVERGIET